MYDWCIVCTVYVMYVSLGNSQERVILYELSMEKLVGAVKRVDVRECVDCTFYVMYVSVGNWKESMIPYKLPMGKLVSVVKLAGKHDPIRTSHRKAGQCGDAC